MQFGNNGKYIKVGAACYTKDENKITEVDVKEGYMMWEWSLLIKYYLLLDLFKWLCYRNFTFPEAFKGFFKNVIVWIVVIGRVAKMYERVNNVCVNFFVALVKSVPSFTLFCRESEQCHNFALLGLHSWLLSFIFYCHFKRSKKALPTLLLLISDKCIIVNAYLFSVTY